MTDDRIRPVIADLSSLPLRLRAIAVRFPLEALAKLGLAAWGDADLLRDGRIVHAHATLELSGAAPTLTLLVEHPDFPDAPLANLPLYHACPDE